MSIVILMKCIKCKRPNENLGFFETEDEAVQFAKDYSSRHDEDLRASERAVFVFTSYKRYHAWSSVDSDTNFNC